MNLAESLKNSPLGTRFDFYINVIGYVGDVHLKHSSGKEECVLVFEAESSFFKKNDGTPLASIPVKIFGTHKVSPVDEGMKLLKTLATDLGYPLETAIGRVQVARNLTVSGFGDYVNY